MNTSHITIDIIHSNSNSFSTCHELDILFGKKWKLMIYMNIWNLKEGHGCGTPPPPKKKKKSAGQGTDNYIQNGGCGPSLTMEWWKPNSGSLCTLPFCAISLITSKWQLGNRTTEKIASTLLSFHLCGGTRRWGCGVVQNCGSGGLNTSYNTLTRVYRFWREWGAP